MPQVRLRDLSSGKHPTIILPQFRHYHETQLICHSATQPLGHLATQQGGHEVKQQLKDMRTKEKHMSEKAKARENLPLRLKRSQFRVRVRVCQPRHRKCLLRRCDFCSRRFRQQVVVALVHASHNCLLVGHPARLVGPAVPTTDSSNFCHLLTL